MKVTLAISTVYKGTSGKDYERKIVGLRRKGTITEDSGMEIYHKVKQILLSCEYSGHVDERKRKKGKENIIKLGLKQIQFGTLLQRFLI